MSPIPAGIVSSARVAPSADYYGAIMAHSPAMYLRLGEASGTVAADASGNGRTGTYNAAAVTLGTAGLIPGDANTAVTMPSTTPSQRVTVTYDGAWMTGDRTVECLIKPSNITDAAGHTVVSQSESAGAGTWHVEIYLSNLYLYAGGGYATGSVVLANNTKYHVAYRHVSGTNTSTLLLNGVQVLTRSGALSGTPSLRAGVRFGVAAAPFVGIMDEVSWIPSALSDAQILAHAQAAGV